MAGAQHSRPSPMAIQKSEAVLVKPFHSTPLPLLSLSTIDDDPYLETLAKTIYVYKPSNSIPDGLDPASLLQHALSKALVYYYPLAGKLKRRSDDRKLQLSCTAEGVPFIRATAACTLDSLDAADVDTTYQLGPSYDVTDGYYHPLALQVTLFSCGGFTVATAISHSVCDGFGLTQFFRAMTELASGMREPTVKPVWERHRLVGQVLDDDDDTNAKPFDLAVVPVATSPYATLTDDVVREIVNVTSDGIKRLKDSIMKEMLAADDDNVGGVVVTTLETLGAYVWRARCRALKLNPEGNTLFGIPVSVRGVMEPPLPEGYYGNAFVNASFMLRGKELNDSPLSLIVKRIKKLKKTALDKRYVRDQLGEMEKTRTTKVNKLEFESGHGAFMFLSDWRHGGYLDEVDFGWKASVDVIPVLPLHLLDVCMFLPAIDGGVKVMVTLPRAAMPAFLEEMDALAH